MLRILDDLTDPELIVLRYHSMIDEADGFYELHEDILEPAGEDSGSTQEEVDRGALREAYEQTLRRHGLLNPRGERPECARRPFYPLYYWSPRTRRGKLTTVVTVQQESERPPNSAPARGRSASPSAR